MLRDPGAKQVFCAYNVGNDEGLSHFSDLVTDEGDLELGDVIARLVGSDLVDQLKEQKLVHNHLRRPRSDSDHLKRSVREDLPSERGILLLGDSFGDDAYSIHGALRIKLDDNTITDDPNAEQRDTQA